MQKKKNQRKNKIRKSKVKMNEEMREKRSKK